MPVGDYTAYDLEGDIQAARFLGAETMAAYAYAYLLGGSPEVKTNADLLFGSMFGGQGGPHSDSHYLWQEYGKPGNPGSAQLYVKAKDFGFAWGLGNGALWPAVRLRNLRPLRP